MSPTRQPVALPTPLPEGLARAGLFVTVWAVTLAMMVLAYKVAMGVSPLLLMPFMLAPLVAYALSPQVGVVTLLTVLVWQNTALSLVAPDVASKEQFAMFQGVNFGVLVFVALYALAGLKTMAAGLTPYGRRVVQACLVLGALLTLYMAYGLSQGEGSGAISYFRQFAMPLLFVLVGLVASRTIAWPHMAKLMLGILLGCLLYGVLEVSLTHALYSWTNKVEYYQFKRFNQEVDLTTYDDLVAFVTTPLFNTHLLDFMGLHSVRLSGPNVHPISYAYTLAIGTLVAVVMQRWALALAAVVLMLMVAAKGPFLMVVIPLASYAVAKATNLKTGRWAMAGVTMAFMLGALWHGMKVEDYHVLGLLGGVISFAVNPLGYGLGAGGNLSRAYTQFSWDDFQVAGHAAFGLESSIGVMLTQVGWLVVPYVLFFAALIRAIPVGSAKHDPQARWFILQAAGGVLLVNGLFQEEAYGPYGLGLLALLLPFLLHDKIWQAPTKPKAAKR